MQGEGTGQAHTAHTFNPVPFIYIGRPAKPAKSGTLSDITLEWEKQSAVCVVMASGGYPVAYKKGERISGLDDISASIVFHAGTSKRDGAYYTNGGRVLGVTALGDTIASARATAYADVSKISFTGAQFRSDIGIK